MQDRGGTPRWGMNGRRKSGGTGEIKDRRAGAPSAEGEDDLIWDYSPSDRARVYEVSSECVFRPRCTSKPEQAERRNRSMVNSRSEATLVSF